MIQILDMKKLRPMLPEYKFLDDAPVKEFVDIQITDGDFTGVTFNFETVNIKEVDDTAILKYTYNTETKFEDNDTRKLFEETLGDILVDIIDKYSEDQEIENRAFNSKDTDRE